MAYKDIHQGPERGGDDYKLPEQELCFAWQKNLFNPRKIVMNKRTSSNDLLALRRRFTIMDCFWHE